MAESDLKDPNASGDANPCVALGLSPSFGFGDRIGSAAPGHVAAMKEAGAGIEPIYPQQSIREMTRTCRTPAEVMRDALRGMRAAGWDGRTGADADHLKTIKDVDSTAAAGFTFFTIDPSDFVDDSADDYDEAALREKFDAIAGEADWINDYQGKTVSLPGVEIEFTEEVLLRAAVKYGRAVNHAVALAKGIADAAALNGGDYEIELSVDETERPTSLAEHFVIADRCLGQEVKLVSLAPRFIGDFEKGVDYKGDLEALERSLEQHAAVANSLGPYKLSLHSGSDKLSMYPALARATQGRFHVKTAGTSYLEALRAPAECDASLFREIINFSRDRFEIDKAT
ncbi:MAG: tagaturonate epimerase family protein, partial [Planctomycetales bacterium]